MPDVDASVEDVFVAVGEQIGFENIISASRINKAIVTFLKELSLVGQLTESKVRVHFKQCCCCCCLFCLFVCLYFLVGLASNESYCF